jgi:hypothetical protein
MKKFAYAALTAICVGAAGLLLTTPLDAKGGGGGGHFGGHGFHGRLNIGPLATRGHPIARNIGPLAGRHFYASRHHHGHHGHYRRGHGGDLLFPGDYGYSDYGYSDYAAPAVAPEDVSDLYAPLPPEPIVAHPVIRTVAESQQVCSSQFVTVPASSGGDTTIRIMRC